jgi:hypothetical protein
VSEACKTILDKLGGYTLVERGIVSIKVLINFSLHLNCIELKLILIITGKGGNENFLAHF